MILPPTPSDPVLADIYDRILTRFTDGQGRAVTSTGTTVCVYRLRSPGKPDNHCAVGCLLTDDELDAIEAAAVNNTAAYTLYSDHPHLLPERFYPYVSLLTQLQHIHDTPDNWTPEGNVIPEALEEALTLITEETH